MSPKSGLLTSSSLLLLAAMFVLPLFGCAEPESIRTYQISREVEDENDRILSEWRAKMQSPLARGHEADAVPGRLLGAMLPHRDHTWFFKVLGDRDAVAKHVAQVQSFVEAIRFDGATPVWALPDDWKEKKPAGSDRFATLLVGDEKPPLELAITALPGNQSVADNVNRWRGQMRQNRLDPAAAEASAVVIDTVAGPARWVDVEGEYVPGASMAPFAAAMAGGGAMPADHPPLPDIPKGPAAKLPDDADLPFRYQAPEGWRPGPEVPMSLLTFVVGDDSAEATVTVTPAGGDLLDNVNRWRGQLGVPPIDEQTLETAATPLRVDGRPAIYVELLGPERAEGKRAVYGAIINDAPPSKWFVKMTGDASVAVRERERFLAFVTSLKFVEK